MGVFDYWVLRLLGNIVFVSSLCNINSTFAAQKKTHIGIGVCWWEATGLCKFWIDICIYIYILESASEYEPRLCRSVSQHEPFYIVF